MDELEPDGSLFTLEGIPSPPRTQEVLGKRKRVDDEDDEESGLFVTQDEGSVDIKQDSDDSEGQNSDDNSEDEDAEADGQDAKDEGGDDDNDDEDGADEESDDEEEDELDCDYYESQEAFPKEAIYDPGIKDIKDGCAAKIAEIKSIFKTHECTTAPVQGFLAKIAALATVPDIEPIRIALLGDTGVGKSSTTNSLLDNVELAKEGAAGKACTCVVTDLQRPFKDQEERYAAQAVYFDEDGMTKLFKELLQNYDLYTFNMDKSWPKDLKHQYRQRTKTALELFLAMFLKHAEFQTEQSAREYLKQQQHDINGTAIPCAIGPSSFSMREATHIWKMAGLRTKTRYSEPALWPLVQKVCVSNGDSRVLKNVTICDLPGVTDTCSLRVNATLESLKSCDVLWIIAKIERIVTDTAVQELLQRYVERFEGKVAIIATRSDDMKMPTLAKDMEDEGYDIGDYKEQTQVSKPAEAAAKKLEKQLRKISDKKQHEKNTLQSALSAERWKANDADTKRLSALVKARNAYVTDGLQRENREHIPEGMELSVFPISNLHYAALKGAITVAPPCLDAEDTGIPALRSYALSLAAPALLQAFEKYVNHQFSVFIKGLDLWADSTYVKSPEGLRAIVGKPEGIFKDKIETHLKRMGDLARHKIFVPIHQKHGEYGTAAKQIVKGWHKWHWCQVRSWVHNNGSHETTARGAVNWNEQFMEAAIRNVITPGWKEVKNESIKLFASLQTDLEAMLMQIATDLSMEPDAISLPLPKFVDMVRTQLEGMRATLDKYRREYFKELANIKLNATLDSETGYFTKAMAHCYVSCQEDSGTGFKNRVLVRFDQAVTLQGDASPFVIMAKETGLAVLAHARKCAGNLEGEFDKILKDIRTNIDAMIDNREPDESETPVRQALKEYLLKNRLPIEDLKAGLEKIKSKDEYKHSTVKQE
ncbi:hypothetical protein LTR85_003605 [Meristemomyces frigidus]|nr:hypothetical protein LTR85_003605 [Meristemomyces frigidus]